MSVYVSCSANFMDLTRLFDYFLCGNIIYQVNNILGSAPPAKHHDHDAPWLGIFINNHYQTLLLLASGDPSAGLMIDWRLDYGKPIISY